MYLFTWMSRICPSSLIKSGLGQVVAIHILAIDGRIPEVVKMYSERMVKVLTFDLFGFKPEETDSDLTNKSLKSAGYFSLSLVQNMGIVLWILMVLLILHLAITMINLCVKSSRWNRQNTSKGRILKKIVYFLKKNFSRSMYISFFTNFQIIVTTSTLLYL